MLLTLHGKVDVSGGQFGGGARVIGALRDGGVRCDGTGRAGVDDGRRGGGGEGRGLDAAGGGGGGVLEVLGTLDDVHPAVSVTLDKLGDVRGVGEVHLLGGVVLAGVGHVLEAVCNRDREVGELGLLRWNGIPETRVRAPVET